MATITAPTRTQYADLGLTYSPQMLCDGDVMPNRAADSEKDVGLMKYEDVACLAASLRVRMNLSPGAPSSYGQMPDLDQDGRGIVRASVLEENRKSVTSLYPYVGDSTRWDGVPQTILSGWQNPPPDNSGNYWISFAADELDGQTTNGIRTHKTPAQPSSQSMSFLSDDEIDNTRILRMYDDLWRMNMCWSGRNSFLIQFQGVEGEDFGTQTAYHRWTNIYGDPVEERRNHYLNWKWSVASQHEWNISKWRLYVPYCWWLRRWTRDRHTFEEQTTFSDIQVGWLDLLGGWQNYSAGGYTLTRQQVHDGFTTMGANFDAPRPTDEEFSNYTITVERMVRLSTNGYALLKFNVT